jgi:DNA-binding transcriptional ArsR family regulator
MENAQIEDVARLLKSIAHPIRLKILCLLQDGELSVGDLLAVVGTTNGNLSQHLAILSLLRGMQSLFCSRGGQQGVPVEPDLAGFGLIEPPECHSDPGD